MEFGTLIQERQREEWRKRAVSENDSLHLNIMPLYRK